MGTQTPGPFIGLALYEIRPRCVPTPYTSRGGMAGSTDTECRSDHLNKENRGWEAQSVS